MDKPALSAIVGDSRQHGGAGGELQELSARKCHDASLTGERTVKNTAQITRRNQRYLQHFPIAFGCECDGWSGARAGSAAHRAWGNGDVAEIANPATVARASRRDATLKHSQAKASPGALTPLASIAVDRWRALAKRAIEPNGYYLPDWALAINASARGRTDVSALGAWSGRGAPDRPDAGDLAVARHIKFPCPRWSAPIPMAPFARRCSIARWPTRPPAG